MMRLTALNLPKRGSKSFPYGLQKSPAKVGGFLRLLAEAIFAGVDTCNGFRLSGALNRAREPQIVAASIILHGTLMGSNYLCKIS